MADLSPIIEFQRFLDAAVLMATNTAYQRKCATRPKSDEPHPPFITHRDVIEALFADGGDELYDQLYALTRGGHLPLVLASLWRLTAAGAILGFEEPESGATPVSASAWHLDTRYWQPKDVLTQLAFVSIGLGGYPPPPEAYDE